jgi:hypothetical protein
MNFNAVSFRLLPEVMCVRYKEKEIQYLLSVEV